MRSLAALGREPRTHDPVGGLIVLCALVDILACVIGAIPVNGIMQGFPTITYLSLLRNGRALEQVDVPLKIPAAS